jgi:hypothetical protein
MAADGLIGTSEGSSLSWEGQGRIEEINGEKIVRFSFPKAFQGHSCALNLFQNREPFTPEGPYLIDYVLCSDFLIHEGGSDAKRPESGHSYLKLGKSLQQLSRVTVTYCHPTDSAEVKEGFLTPLAEEGTVRRLRVEVPERELEVALKVSSKIVHSVLDVISLRREVPTQIRHIEVRREVGADRFLRRYVTLPYHPVEIEEEDIVDAFTIPLPLFPALRLFREAISSSNPYYRLLCLYRVREAIERVRKTNDHTLIAQGVTPYRPVRRIPDNDLTQCFIPTLIGKRFGAFLDYVYETYRIPIAHFTPDEYERMLLDPADVRVDHRVDYTNAVLILVIKQMISDEVDLMKKYNLG